MLICCLVVYNKKDELFTKYICLSYQATPLYIASRNGHVECVNALIQAGGQVDKAMDGGVSTKLSHELFTLFLKVFIPYSAKHSKGHAIHVHTGVIVLAR